MYMINHLDPERVIYDLETKPVEVCRFCTERPEKVAWSVSSCPQAEDWLVNEDGSC